MKMNELGLVYFSPTGTTRKVIMAAARNIDLKSVSYDLSIHKEKKPAMQFKKNDLVLFGIPVYAGRVPKTFLEYFENLQGDNTPACGRTGSSAPAAEGFFARHEAEACALRESSEEKCVLFRRAPGSFSAPAPARPKDPRRSEPACPAEANTRLSGQHSGKNDVPGRKRP